MDLNMDVNTLRVAVTVLLLFAFLGIVCWAWSRKNAAAFAEAAQLPLMEDDGSPR